MVAAGANAMKQRGDKSDELGEMLTDDMKKEMDLSMKISNHFLDPNNFPYPINKYVTIGNFCFKCKEDGEAYAAYFDGFIIVCICIAGVMVGLQTYPVYENEEINNTEHPWIPIINNFILIAFIVEAMVKVCAEGMAPWRYFVGPDWRWNLFDFTIVVLSMPFLESTVFSTDAGSVKILRLFRLARLAKLVNKVPKLRMIVMGLIGGLQSISYIMLLLLLVFYMFGIAGMSLFADNDPFHFNTVPRAILSLFRAATLEDWSDIMYISMYGCDAYSSGMYVTGTNDELIEQGVPKMFRCTAPSAQPGLAATFWVLFIMICSFVMLSLFIGVITIAMSDSISEMQKMQQETTERRRQAKKEKLSKSMTLDDVDLQQPDNVYTFSQKIMLKSLVREANHMLSNSTFADDNDDLSPYLKFSKFCAFLAESTFFTNLIILMILLAGAFIGIENSVNTEKMTDLARFLLIGDLVINIIFTCEVVIKIFAEGKEPLNYFKSNWNQFDFVVTFFSWPVVPGGDSSNLKILRIFRLFRVLKLLSRFPDLAMIVNALISGFESIGFISLIMLLVFYLFAVLGVSLFRDNDPWHFGKLHRAMLTLFRIATYEDWTDVMYINVLGCDKWGYSGDDSQPKGKDCVDSKGKGLLAAIYFVIFAIISAMVLLTLFVGVVSTSMDEAGAKAKKQLELENAVDDFGKEQGIPTGVLVRWRKLFSMLDADEGGTLDSEEVKHGFVSVGVIHPNFDLMKLFLEMEKSGTIEHSDELSILDFVKFMFEFNVKSQENHNELHQEEAKL